MEMARTNRKPEQDQAAEEIAHQEGEGASVTDSGPVPGQTEVFVGEMGETSEGILPPGGADEQPAAEGETTEGVEIEETTEIEIETEVTIEDDSYAPGDPAPAAGLYVAIGNDVEMKEGERFPPFGPATRWARVTSDS